MLETYVYTMLCCNDPSNGLPLNKVCSIEINDCLELECRYSDWSPSLSGDKDFIRIGGYKLICAGYRTWVGNWCWDGCYVRLSDLFRFFNSYRVRKWFDCTSGEQRLFNLWDSGGKFDIRDLGGTVRLFDKYAQVKYREPRRAGAA